eukprot:GCRY01003722.1.p1 GENE.GCRY01003722.1~~GCRY01003722.1.p1  ORF type:complete len:770 (-),score=50.88 GCRY01003722.1:215-2524(-)
MKNEKHEFNHRQTDQRLFSIKNNEFDKGQANIPLSHFFELLTRRNAVVLRSHPPSLANFESVLYRGKTEKENCSLTVEFSISVLPKVRQWVILKLLSSEVVLLSSSIVWKQTSIENEECKYVKTEAFITIIDGWYSLVTPCTGQVTVTLNTLCKYQTSAGRSVFFAIPFISQSTLSWAVSRKNIDIKVENALESYQTVEGNETFVCAHLAPAHRLSVSWTSRVGTCDGKERTKHVELENDESFVNQEKKKEIVFNSTQFIRCSIGEGVLLLENSVDYKIVSGALSMLEVRLPAGVRVISVEGNWIRKWDVIPYSHSPNVIPTGSSDVVGERSIAENDTQPAPIKPFQYQVVRTYFSRLAEKSHKLIYVYEMELPSANKKLTLPSMKTLTTGINREKGYISVSASTNVEILELLSKSASRLGVQELPFATRPEGELQALFAYKFLHTGYSIVLDVRKHQDVAVLTATVDNAFFTATVSEESFLYRLRFAITNTTRQYLRVSVPKYADIWSTMVSGQSVKPVFDTEEEVLMIPLAKARTFLVELIYSLKGSPFANHSSSGVLSSTFPVIDIPINHLYVQFYLPEGFHYRQFSGSFSKPAHVFSQGLPSLLTQDLTGEENEPLPFQQSQVQQGQCQHQPLAATRKLDLLAVESNVVMDDDFDSESNSSHSSEMDEECQMIFDDIMIEDGNTHAVAKAPGILPVKIKFPEVGKEFKFEKLLINGKALNISVHFSKCLNHPLGMQNRTNVLKTTAWFAFFAAAVVTGVVIGLST